MQNAATLPMQSLATLPLFDFNIVNETRHRVFDWLFEKGKKTIAFANAHCMNVAAQDPAYRWALQRASAILPDGSGMQLAAKMNGAKFVENLNGTDLFPPLMKEAAARGLGVFFFGSQPGIAQKAAKTAEGLAPGLKVTGTRHGFFTPAEEDGIIERINASGASIVLVALGVPKQDLWIARNRHRLNAELVFGVGAQFDFWSGRVSRAPGLLRKLGLEWTWRFAIEPRRMFRRYVLGNPAFILRAARERLASQMALDSGRISRRALDIAMSGGALLALSPLFALIAAAIRLESSGPVFFTQQRVGKDGELFKVYKFRSMYKDAEARRAALLHLSERKGVCFKSKNDPRVTRMGRILRRFSLDELPQIINVLKGEMAIVGPRPALPQEVAAYPQKALARLAVKPGLTGPWQVSGRAEISFDRMVNMDLAYAKTRTLLTDVLMIMLTVRAVVSGRGAY
ncbi:MAG: WecB/TagA/CpsF family glycosyltransferase [Alphaproteobacteria bacterium]|nr:WecB/TagA/CpsF family glycosyltransferase [Alphaproteobacteria bacterium]